MPQYGPALQYHVLYNKEVNANPNIVRVMDQEKVKRQLHVLEIMVLHEVESLICFAKLFLNSAASGSVCSSDESDDTNQEFSASERQRFNQLLADGVVSQKNATVQYHVPNTDLALQVLVATTSETDLNLRMRHSASSAQTILMKEEHELKKERRKQSNRESARRLRLHRQQECEKLQAVVEILRTESSMLKDELMRLSEDSGNLGDENNSIMVHHLNPASLL
ncbi:hypothetical protein FH972_004979 [Carpinus fangiana]|uniref:BZIP domain-containing protein n=1 Tax=Carpinus fangiana TaxID=176857 RepID=A0A5N6QRB6_9ROSI|nr:hypothetical protein FH972_004979 [Carpinus fangiana]